MDGEKALGAEAKTFRGVHRWLMNTFKKILIAPIMFLDLGALRNAEHAIDRDEFELALQKLDKVRLKMFAAEASLMKAFVYASMTNYEKAMYYVDEFRRKLHQTELKKTNRDYLKVYALMIARTSKLEKFDREKLFRRYDEIDLEKVSKRLSRQYPINEINRNVI